MVYIFSFPFIALALRARAISRQLEKYIPYCPHNHTLTSTYWGIFNPILRQNRQGPPHFQA